MGIMKKYLITILQTIFILSILSACIADPGVAKNTGRVKDYSLSGANSSYCGTGYVIWSQLTYCAQNACPAQTHLASALELSDAKQFVLDTINNNLIGTSSPTTAPVAPNGEVPVGGTVDQTLLDKINGSSGICLKDVPPPRPTGQVYINTDFCSCLNGQSDIINDCSTACSKFPKTAAPMLYLSTTVGPNIQLNQSLQNLQGWCSNTLPQDKVNPQCTLSAYDGTNTISGIKINSIVGNSLTADLTSLALNKTYIVTIVETASGSNAKSSEFQIRRVPPVVPVTGPQGALKIAPISQYSCLSYEMTSPTPNVFWRTGFIRQTYYFAANETPTSLPPVAAGMPANLVCHDEVLHPGNDNALYPRLELIPQHFSMWDKTDQRFAPESTTNARLKINVLLENRLFNEYSVTVTSPLDLFAKTSWSNRPNTGTGAAQSVPMGYRMIPFTDPITSKTICPTQVDFLTSTDPLFKLLKDYMDSTEALYLAEKEPEILSGAIFYGTMFITEGIVKKYGFYIENGLKIKADQAALETKTIYYYWPVNNTMDPLLQGDRKLYTIRSPDALNGAIPTTIAAGATTDRRVGCVPTTTVP